MTLRLFAFTAMHTINISPKPGKYRPIDQAKLVKNMILLLLKAFMLTILVIAKQSKIYSMVILTTRLKYSFVFHITGSYSVVQFVSYTNNIIIGNQKTSQSRKTSKSLLPPIDQICTQGICRARENSTQFRASTTHSHRQSMARI